LVVRSQLSPLGGYGEKLLLCRRISRTFGLMFVMGRRSETPVDAAIRMDHAVPR
jgi:hypothetical protein